MPKIYRGTFLLGRTSDTEDVAGQVSQLTDVPQPSGAQIESVLPQFIGTIQQRPPAYSALKVQGRRAYELARRGQQVDLASRAVEIHSIEIVAYSYPELALLICCGGGTYVRTLGRDIARSLGTDAVMSSLRREAIGPFRCEQALSADALTWPAIRSHLLSPLLAVEALAKVSVTAAEARRFVLGQGVADRWHVQAAELAAVDERGGLVAIVAPAGGDELRTTKAFPVFDLPPVAR
jgi:tRNA pseudouridine55 synthase